MPAFYKTDKAHKAVLSTASGVFRILEMMVFFAGGLAVDSQT